MSKARSGGRILVDGLLAQGADRIFCVPGESYLAVLDALYDTPAIDLVVCRQEGGAAYMAEADGKMTGRPGIAFVTRGPGATNAAIGVHVAMQDSTPVLLFVGDVARDDRDREAFQEIDFPAMFAPIAKWTARIDNAARIPEYIRRAYAVSMSGRPGPVVLALPEDMLIDHATVADAPRVERPAQAPAACDIADIAARLSAAKAPMAIIGGAGWTAGTALAWDRFACDWGLPSCAAFRRQDAVPNADSSYVGNLGYGPNPALVNRIRAADLLIVAGPRLGEATTDGYTLITPDHPGQTLIHIHPDPDELNKVYRADLALCAGVTETARALAELPAPATPHASFAAARLEWEMWNNVQPTGEPLDVGLVVEAMAERLPPDTIICNGAGNFSSWWHRHWRYAGPGSQLAPTAGTMGYGLPAAIAACLRHPHRQVVAVAGDGCFLMNGQELATAIRHRAKALILVVNNNSYGTIRMHQERAYPSRVSGTGLVNPDFSALAQAYGAYGECVEVTEDFPEALDRALDFDGPALIELRLPVERIAPNLTISAIRNASR